MVTRLQQAGFLVHPYTAQDDFLNFTDDAISEYLYYYNHLKVDGIFTESPRTAVLSSLFAKTQNEIKYMKSASG